MSEFKRTIAQFFRLSSKFRRPLLKSSEVTLPEETAVAPGESNWLPDVVHSAPNSTLQPPLDSEMDPSEVEEKQDEDDVNVRENEGGQDAGNPNVTDDEKGEGEGDASGEVDLPDEEDEDTLETYPFELARKTRIEMMVNRLYVALSDDDEEIAALRTRHCEPFTHIVRITFDPPCEDEELSPSSWSKELSFPEDAPFELRLLCPPFARFLDEKSTALTKQQLVLARKYITFSLPYRNDTWDQQASKFPFSTEQCQDARLLIVGPTDRSVDVMAVLVSYLTSLTGAPAPKLLHSIQKLDLVHKHWKDCARGNMACPVSPQ